MPDNDLGYLWRRSPDEQWPKPYVIRYSRWETMLYWPIDRGLSNPWTGTEGFEHCTDEVGFMLVQWDLINEKTCNSHGKSRWGSQTTNITRERPFDASRNMAFKPWRILLFQARDPAFPMRPRCLEGMYQWTFLGVVQVTRPRVPESDSKHSSRTGGRWPFTMGGV